jgi:hypothetical protein
MVTNEPFGGKKISKFWTSLAPKIAIGGMKFPILFLQAVLVTSSSFPRRNS